MENNLSASEQLALLQPTAATPIVSLPSTANQGVVDLYTQMLGRKPDPEGYAFYDQKFGSNVGPAERAEFSQNAIAERARQPNIAFTAPRVSGARTDLNQVQNIIRDAESRRLNETMAAIAASDRPNRSPFAPIPSLSQQVADENAAQDRMIINAYNNAGVNLSTTDLNSMRGQLEDRAIMGDPVKKIDPTFLYERRVADAYKNIGREGNAVDREGFDYFLNKLKSGEVSPTNFNDFFLGTAANYTGPGASSLLDSINKARTLTNMPLTNTTQLAADQVAAAAAAAAGQVPGAVTPTTPAPTTPAPTTPTPTTPAPAPTSPVAPTLPFGVFPNSPGAREQILGGGAIAMGNPVAPTTPLPIPTDITRPIPPLTPTRDQVLAAYANNPRAVRVPDEEAINFFMQPGKLANFDAIVEQVRDANPELAKQIDEDRFVAPSPSTNQFQFGTQNQNQGLMRFMRNGGPVKK